MPIRRERRRLYPADWDRISLRIRGVRAGWRCEWTDPDGRRCEAVQGKPNPLTGSTVRLAAAHLDHDETGSDPARIACLCQFHHLTHDAVHHRRNAAETRRRQMGTPDLFGDAPGVPVTSVMGLDVGLVAPPGVVVRSWPQARGRRFVMEPISSEGMDYFSNLKAMTDDDLMKEARKLEMSGDDEKLGLVETVAQERYGGFSEWKKVYKQRYPDRNMYDQPDI